MQPENNSKLNSDKSNRELKNPIKDRTQTELGQTSHFVFPQLVLIIGVAVALIGFFQVTKSQEDRAMEAFKEEALHDITTSLDSKINQNISVCEGMKALFSASNYVSRQEFSTYVEHELGRHSEIQALEWIPYVRHAERGNYETNAQKDGLSDFQFTERLSNGLMVRREQQEEYFPVYFVEPFKGNETALGFDLASNPDRLEALFSARDTGQCVGSSPITLVQEESQQFGILIFCPIYKKSASVDTIEERRSNLNGFVLGVYRIGDLINSALEVLSDEGIRLLVYDLDVTEEKLLIFSQQNIENDSIEYGSLTTSTILKIADRKWQLKFFTTSDYMSVFVTNLRWYLLSGIIFFFVMLSFFIYNLNRKSIQLELEGAKSRTLADELTRLIDTANAPIFGIDMQGKVNEWNQAAEKITKFIKEDVLGYDFVAEFISDEYKKPVRKVLQNALKGKETKNYELPLYTNDGRLVLILLNATTRKNVAGDIVGVIGIGQDITELDKYRSSLEHQVEKRTRNLEKALDKVKELNQLKTDFLSTAAHELRTPLTSIRGFSEILLSRQLAEKRQTHFMTLINQQATSLGQIIDDLLDISRLEAGRGMEISSNPLDMANLMQEVIETFIVANTKHKFIIEEMRKYSPLMGDPFRLTQVGNNIISNAVKYSPDGGEIIIRTRLKNGFLEISVQDEGIGMTPNQVSHLFETFYRADTSNTSISGTGLGLAISKTIVELHRGKLWVESEKGVGTTVFVTLPLLEDKTRKSTSGSKHAEK